MNSIWVPLPISLFLRRAFNVLSTASITHQYLLHRPDLQRDETSSTGSDGARTALRRIWSFWSSESTRAGTQASTSLAGLPLQEAKWGSVVQALGISLPWPRWSSPASLLFRRSAAAQDELDVSEPDREPKMRPREPSPPPENHDPTPENDGVIQQLMRSPVLFDPVRAPRYPIVLCHGLYGFDVRGPSAFPSLRMHYWSSILNILRKTIGAEVLVTSVPGTGSIASRSRELDHVLKQRALGRGVNFLAHSMGGLDCRHLITHLQPTEYTPLSLTSIATPHRGSPFMDWCTDYLGLGRTKTEKAATAATAAVAASQVAATSSPEMNSRPQDQKTDTKLSSLPFSLSLSSLPSSFTTLLLSAFDSPAYANLTTTYLNTVFNPSTPDDPRVRYFSVAGRTGSMNVWHPLWLPKLVLDSAEEKHRKRLQQDTINPVDTVSPWIRDELWGNDGLVTVQSARWGEFLGIVDGCDHWEIRGASGIEMGVDIIPSVVGEGWGFRDWGRFVRALGRLERRAEARNKGTGDEAAKQTARDQADDDALKSSTDRLSAVVDWIVDQVPTDSLPSLPFAAGSKASSTRSDTARAKPSVKKKEPEPKLDLERFYVALTRKLYDEGL
ncbi:alpha/beta-hydrolase [Auriscalpium vulgare]|uniref:Alpha/beta-hydrolase n=1 Tax=Auriscalpium vulgare TaxID=40419 RepID=A0ACB8RZX4_9AGAM|nr:alpha/beta-hydrolase [Auriscalpium vulgare]